MKWGRKKFHSSSPSFSISSSSSSYNSSLVPNCSQPSSLISHVISVSWLSKFKQKKSSKQESKPRKLNPIEKKLKCPSLLARNNGTEKFYGFDDDSDAYWRLSFGQDHQSVEKDKSKRVGFSLKPSVWYNDELEETFLSCPNCGSKEDRKLSLMQQCKREKGERVLMRKSEGDLEKVKEEEEDKMSFDLQSLREMKAKSEEQRKSFNVSMERQKKRNTNNNKRVKAYALKTGLRGETCRVKALEDMKKAKLKQRRKKKSKEKNVGSEPGLDRFAVVKSSYEPEKDFKDSMVEMILEKNMSQPDELEELLACYLTLNPDEIHGLIIKVFREVWFELSELRG